MALRFLMADIEYHVEGVDRVEIEVRNDIKDVVDDVKDAMTHAAEAAVTAMQLGVPIDSGELWESIDIGPLVFRPGGPGGGGSYHISVEAGEGQEEKISWVTEGTRGPIYPKHGKALKIQKEGEPVKYRAWVSGQEPQTDWIIEGQRAADEVLDRLLGDI